MEPLAELYSAIDSARRRIKDMVSNPVDSVRQAMNIYGENFDKALALQDTAYLSKDKSITKEQRAAARSELGALATEAAFAGATVYHGSPHKFDKFDSAKIGTGEGAQAYGRGLYVAEKLSVAKEYSKGNAPSVAQVVMPDGRVKIVDVPRQPGSLYKIDLPDDKISKMLDWDKKLSEQSDHVQTAIANMHGISKADFKAILAIEPDKFDVTGKTLITNATSKAGSGVMESRLRDVDIPGIKYTDGISMDRSTGTSNYVVFPGNEDILNILEVR